MRAIIYARTSGDEDSTGQDVVAQGRDTWERAKARGIEPTGVATDNGVSGDTPPLERPGFQEALRAVHDGKADGIALKEISRFSRCDPTDAMHYWRDVHAQGVRILSLTEAHFDTLTHPDTFDDANLVLVRFISFWATWVELRTIRRRTQETMDALTDPNRPRPTKSGRPVGRPTKALTRDEIEWVRAELASKRLSLRRAALELSRRRGAFDTTNPKRRAELTVSRTTIAAALRNGKQP